MKIYEPNHFWKIAKEYIIKKDNELQKEGKYYIDKQLAMKCIKFTSFLTHTDGTLLDVNFQLVQWQIEAIVDVFCTKYSDGEYKGLRRYQRALFFMPKKNGKTELGAVFHLIMFFIIDPNKVKNQFSVAGDSEQALILHSAIETMIKSSFRDLDLMQFVEKIKVQPPTIKKKNDIYPQTIMALAKPVGNSDSKDGKKVTFFTSDEGHSHPSKSLYQLIKNGMASQKEPLEINISTAGKTKTTYFFKDIYLYGKKVKQGIIKDERFYSVIFEIDNVEEIETKEPDFWKKEKYWKLANPAYPVSPTKSFLEGLVSESEHSEESLVTFKIKHLNIWQEKAKTWIKSSVWNNNQSKIGFTKLKELRGRRCYGGLDLSTRVDITALVLIFDDLNGGYDVIPYFWIPKDKMIERVNRDKVPYFDWVKQGLITPTDGNVVDYNVIEDKIKRLCKFFNVQMIGYDPWNSSDLVRRLTQDEVVELIQLRQGFTLSSANKQIEVLALQGKLNHAKNEVLGWMCSNIVLEIDKNDNYKLDKKASIEKIDGIVALSMALTLAIKDIEEKEEESIYNTRGLLEL